MRRLYVIGAQEGAPPESPNTHRPDGVQPDAAPSELVLGGRRYRLVPVTDEAGRGPVALSRPAPERLTARELQIVALVAEGHVNKQIADDLRISEWTVSTHLRRIFAKLGVDTRAAMVSRCMSLLRGTNGNQ